MTTATHDPDALPDLANLEAALRRLEAQLAERRAEVKAIKEQVAEVTGKLRLRIREAVEVGLFNRGEGAEGGGG